MTSLIENTNIHRRAGFAVAFLLLATLGLALFISSRAGGASDPAAAYNASLPSDVPADAVQVGDARMWVGNRNHHPEGYQCLTVFSPIFALDGGSVTNCPPPKDFAERGFVQTYQLNDGPVFVYGVAPGAKAADVSLDGKRVPDQSGGFFFAKDVGAGAHDLVMDSGGNTQPVRITVGG